MRVFLTGATGYVGFAVATALRRAGHDVYGLTRAAAKVPQLARQEIRPVIGDIGDPKSYADTAEECSVLVHAAFESSASAVAKDKTALVALRPAHEQLVLQAKAVRGLVIRPGCVYGGRGGMTGDWFAAAAAGKPPTVVGSSQNRWAMVHIDDLADAYVRAAERGLTGEVFDVTDRSRATVLEMATAAARAAGFQGELRPVPLGEARRTMGDFADALALDQHVDARKAVRLLDWQPRHGGFVDEADILYAAWKAG